MKLLTALILSALTYSAFAQVPPHRRCPTPVNLQCEDFVSSYISRGDARDRAVQRRIRLSCAGNPGSSCVSASLSVLPSRNRNNTEDVLRVARSCALTRMSCVNYVASSLPSSGYDSLNEVTEITRACAQADGSCVKARCESSAYDCGSRQGLLRAAESCFEGCWRQ